MKMKRTKMRRSRKWWMRMRRRRIRMGMMAMNSGRLVGERW
jgi:hypothetical protein